MEREQKKTGLSLEKEEQVKKEQPFSDDIKNAHASGDGSINRSNEAIDQPKQNTPENEGDRTTY